MRKKGERERKSGKKKVTVTQRGTRTHNLANGLPCSNRATESPGNSMAEFQYLRLSCQGFRYQAGMSNGGGMVTAKCKAHSGSPLTSQTVSLPPTSQTVSLPLTSQTVHLPLTSPTVSFHPTSQTVSFHLMNQAAHLHPIHNGWLFDCQIVLNVLQPLLFHFEW